MRIHTKRIWLARAFNLSLLFPLVLGWSGCSLRLYNLGKTNGLTTTGTSLKVHGPADHLSFIYAPPSLVAQYSEIPIKVGVYDKDGLLVNDGPDSSASITLSGSSGLTGTLTLSASGGIADFTYQGVNFTSGGAKTLTATKASTQSSGGVQSLSLLSSAFNVIGNLSWWGSTAVATGAFVTGNAPVSGVGDGMLYTPYGSYVDGSGNIYVTEAGGSRRVSKFTSTGAFVGWIGTVIVPPTGGAAGCTTTTINKTTPGWCTGGHAGGLHPGGITGDATYIYVALGDHVARYNASTGAMNGWIGRLGATYSADGNPADTYTAGCSTLVVGQNTPGWCAGGAAETGKSEGALSNSSGIATDGTYLYVLDIGSPKIQRFNLSTGASAGWIGKASTAASCAVDANSVTTAWCTDATAVPASSSTADGGLFAGTNYGGIYYDAGTTSLYVTNLRVQKYTASTGAFVGWSGMVSTTPTGGPGTCTSTAVWANTPDWCTGGNSTLNGSYRSYGSLPNPGGITGDGTYLYIMDSGRIVRLSIANGTWQGWVGKIYSGTCTGGVGNFTSGWCTDSASVSDYGNGDGMLAWSKGGMDGWYAGDYSGGIIQSGGNLYVADSGNSRLSVYTTAGAFTGWLGAKESTNATWQYAAGIAGGSSWVPGSDDTAFGPIPGGVTSDGNNLYLTDWYRIRKIDNSSVTSPVSVGWFGNVSRTPTGGGGSCTSLSSGSMTPAWCTGGSSSSANNGLNVHSYDVPQMTTDGTYLYYSQTNRVLRVRLSDLSDQGWIGQIGANGGTCTGTVGTFTGGWCTGGSPGTGSGDGQFSRISGLALGGQYLYASDIGNNRVSRFVASTGAFAGWIGGIGTSPTSGASGCAGGTGVTPGWCYGGTGAITTTNDGLGDMDDPQGVSVDSNYIYVASLYSFNISRYKIDTGAFAGWIGNLQTQGGTCTGAVGHFNGGWCIGGRAQSTTSAELTMDNLFGVYSDGNSIYALATSQILKFNASTGAYVGTRAYVNSGSLTGDSICSTATIGQVTPGWCKGIVAPPASTPGSGFSNVWSITGAGNFIYVTDLNVLYRIGK